jgi:hypothetical protein
MSLKLDLLAAIALLSFEPPTQAHDIYLHLKDRLGNSCCDDKDCRPALYRVTPTGAQMLVNGDWIAVPEYTIQYRVLPEDTGETAGGHWCGYIRHGYGDKIDYSTLCAVLPPNPTAIFGPPIALREERVSPIP